jgi:hypothetical protein
VLSTSSSRDDDEQEVLFASVKEKHIRGLKSCESVILKREVVRALPLKNVFAAAFISRYNQEKINAQMNAIVDSCLKELQSLNRPFK